MRDPVPEPEPPSEGSNPPARWLRRRSRLRPDAKRRSEFCLNCGSPTPDNFCPRCGQRNTHYRVSTWEILGEAAGELFQLDSRVLATVGTLLWRPGRLTNEYVAGRRVSYSSPLRVYLVSSVLYFLALSLLSFTSHDERPPVPAKSSTQTDASGKATPFSGGALDAIINIDDNDNNVWKRRLKERVDSFRKPTQMDAKDRFLGAMMAHTPTALFVLMPIFALLLKLAYIARKRFYSEHLVFTLHVHSFAFIALLGATLIHGAKAIVAAIVLIMIYLYLAQRRVYGQGRFRTFLKWNLLLFLYFWVLLIGLVVAALAVFAFG